MEDSLEPVAFSHPGRNKTICVAVLTEDERSGTEEWGRGRVRKRRSEEEEGEEWGEEEEEEE